MSIANVVAGSPPPPPPPPYPPPLPPGNRASISRATTHSRRYALALPRAGHAKCNFITYDIFTNKKIEDMVPSTHGTTVPIITRTEYSLNDITDEGFLALMDEAGEVREDLQLPKIPEGYGDEIQAAFEEDKPLILTVLKSMGEEMVISHKEDTTIE